MAEITVLTQAPVVFTKDADWKANTTLEPGAIILLPEDAVLYEPPITLEAPSPRTGEANETS